MTTNEPDERAERPPEHLGWTAVLATRSFAILIGIVLLGIGGVLIFFLFRLIGG